ncbi:MAG TPA: hypothetical protein VME70_01830 [Mycobacteriales bacterium]|nr:hypothetical protein [Mycobacteriales bacterium]
MRRSTAVASTFLALSVALGAAGCASASSSGKISVAAADALKPYVHAVRVAAAGKHRGPLQSAINQLRSEVDALQRDGKLSQSRAVNILNAADALFTDFVATLPSPSPAASSPSPSPPPTSTSPAPTVTVTITPSTSGPTTSPPQPPGQTHTPPGQTKSKGPGGPGG